MEVSRPGPGVQLAETLGVDFDDDKSTRRRTFEEPELDIHEGALDRCEQSGEVGRGNEREDEQM
jgi:hypothetical protein